jgi:hypothetical protein
MQKNTLFLLCVLIFISPLRAQLPAGAKKQPGNAPAIKSNTGIQIDPITLTRTVTVRPATLSNLCPVERTGGDHEFAKNELHIEVSVSYLGDNGRDSVLKARIFISASERGGDGSAVRQAFIIPVYTAPPGFVLKRILSSGRTAAFSFDTKDGERPKPQVVGACTTYVYNLSKASLGFDLDQQMLTDMKINTRNVNGDDFSESEGSCGCGFRIQSIAFKPFDVVLERKRP